MYESMYPPALLRIVFPDNFTVAQCYLHKIIKNIVLPVPTLDSTQSSTFITSLENILF